MITTFTRNGVVVGQTDGPRVGCNEVVTLDGVRYLTTNVVTVFNGRGCAATASVMLPEELLGSNDDGEGDCG